MDTRERLYRSYTTESVGFNAGTVGNSRPYLLNVVSRFFPRDKQARILDLGCGYGSLLLAARDCGYANCSGVDVSQQQVSQAKALGLENVTQGDIMSFLTALPDASVDVLCAFDVLEHLTTEELLTIGDQMCRVLAPGGRCILHAPNAAGLFGSAIRYGDLTHERAFTESSMSQFAQNVGMKLGGVYEDKPTIHGAKSLVRYICWILGTIPFRILSLAETGRMPAALSRNFLCILHKQ